MLHIASSLVVIIICVGLYFRHRRPELHIRMMIAAFVVDLLLVLWIEGTRHAVEKVARSPRPLIWFHACISLGVLACYVVMIVLGRRVLSGTPASKKTHRNLGMVFVALRATNYVTALML